MTRRLYIVRHGNTFDPGDTVTRVGARTDLPLSRSGRLQAQALSAHFKETPFAEALTSPLRRTRETAETILAARAAPPPLEIADFLREIDYGPDENRTESDVIARIGETSIRAWDDNATPPPGWKVDPEALVSAWKALFERLCRIPPDGRVLAVTSNGIARFALRAADEVPADTALKLKTGAYGVITISGNGLVTVETWNIQP